MHIAHFVRDLDGHGGIERYVARLGDGLRHRGHQITYFGLQGDDSVPSRVQIDDAASLYNRVRDEGIDVLHLHKVVESSPPEDLVVLRTVHDNGATCPSGSRYLKRTGEPCPRTANVAECIFGHYIDGCGSRRPHKVWRNFQRMYANQRVLPGLPTITVSEFLRDQMVELGYPGDAVHVIRSPAPDGPSVPPPLPTGDVPHILFLGRLVPEKGIDWLLRATAQIRDAVHVDIAGEGYYRSTLETEASRLDLTDTVTFHGWVEGGARDDLMRRARALVVPSVWHEPAGLVPLEAAAWGRPVVAADVGGLPEYAAAPFSTLVPPNDDEQLARALAALCSDPEEAEARGRAGHAYVRKNHDLTTCLSTHEEMYSSLTGKNIAVRRSF